MTANYGNGLSRSVKAAHIPLWNTTVESGARLQPAWIQHGTMIDHEMEWVLVNLVSVIPGCWWVI